MMVACTETGMHTSEQEAQDIKKCDYCGAEEGKPRMVGDFIVSLVTVSVKGKTKKACQSCCRKHPALRRLYFRKN